MPNLRAFKKFDGHPGTSIQFPPRRLTGKTLSVSFENKNARIFLDEPSTVTRTIKIL